MQRLSPLTAYRLYSVQSTRALEQAAASDLAPHTLMQRAGLAVANLACAVAPHAHTMWLACGPGNNGGDGLEAAMHLQQRGYHPVVTWLGQPEQLPADALASWQRAVQSGVAFTDTPPERPDLCVDALLGIGSTRQPDGTMARWINHMNHSGTSVLAVDVPTGLDADTGGRADTVVQADHTLSLLTLKPGLFTAHGRDAVGQVWWDDLGAMSAAPPPALALLPGRPATGVGKRLHASHKGSRGDVAVVGGSNGMVGAALLAASAALHAGAGRVFVSLLGAEPLAVNSSQPELMLRAFADLKLDAITVVCGCGGGTAVRTVLPELLRQAPRLVLDADALNAIATEASLQSLLRQRPLDYATVLTPHPLEAARLLGTTTAQVQANRLAAGRQLSDQYGCTVVLKGSGTVTTAPGQTALINPTGNGLLATGGTGDVLAGLIGAHLASGVSAWEAAWVSVYQQGQVADQWPPDQALTASALANALT